LSEQLIPCVAALEIAKEASAQFDPNAAKEIRQIEQIALVGL
jgi:hypothetical protein